MTATDTRIESRSDLEALPVGAVVISRADRAWTRERSGWRRPTSPTPAGVPDCVTSDWLFHDGPLVAVWIPDRVSVEGAVRYFENHPEQVRQLEGREPACDAAAVIVREVLRRGGVGR